jgi:hypothetical protein
MAFQHIRIKNTNVVGKIPGADKIDVAELCVNLKDHKLFSKDADGNIFELGRGVDSGANPPGSGNEIGDLWWDGDYLLVWNGTDWEQVAGDLQAVTDKGNTTDNSIQIGTGFGGSTATGVTIANEGLISLIKRANDARDMISAIGADGISPNREFKVDNQANVLTNAQVTSGTGAGSSFIGVQLRPAGNLTIANVNGTNMILATANGNKTFKVGADSEITTDGGVTSVFGTSTAQLGNVAPLNDWSCYPARA